jgi:hypothetical protein
MKKIFLLIFAMFVTFGIKAATTTGFRNEFLIYDWNVH